MAGMYGCCGKRNSDSATMASDPPDVMANQEAAEVVEEGSGKKMSKFQTFKKFFTRKKRKEASVSRTEEVLKASQSSDNVNTPENCTLTRSERGIGSKASLGSKALSHDSLFVSDLSEANEALGASQDSIHGKVKSLQLQLKQAIRLGSPPSLVCLKRTEDVGTMSEDDGLPCSPPEYSIQHTELSQPQRESSLSLEGTDSDEDQLSHATSSRAVSPLLAIPGDFSLPASPFGCLDNSAAKHKLRLRHKACNQRKPASRVEIRGEGDCVAEEEADESIYISETLESKGEEEETEDVTSDQLRTKEEEAKKKAKQTQHSKLSLLRDEEEEQEELVDNELGAGKDVFHALDTSSTLLCYSDQCFPWELAQDAQTEASFKPTSRTSSMSETSDSPESPAGQKEYLLDPPAIPCGKGESRIQTDDPQAGEDEVTTDMRVPADAERGDEESSFLQEVLSSLKTPLTSSALLGLEIDAVTLEMEDVRKMENKEEGEGKTEEGEEVKREETELENPLHFEAIKSHEDEVNPLCKMDPSSMETRSGEEEKDHDDDQDEDIAEVVEQLTNYREVEEEEGDMVKEVCQEPCPEKNEHGRLLGKCDIWECEDKEGEEKEEMVEWEENHTELEREPEVEEEEEEGEKKKDTWEEEEEKGKVKAAKAIEALEEEEENTYKIAMLRCSTINEMAQMATPALEAHKALDTLLGEDTALIPMLHGCSYGDRLSFELCDQPFTSGQEGPEAPNQSFMDDNREGGCKREKENTDMHELGCISAYTQAMEMNQSSLDQAGSNQADDELDCPNGDQLDHSHQEMTNTEKDQTEVPQIDADKLAMDQATISSQISPLSLSESQIPSETQAQEDNKSSVPCTINVDNIVDSNTNDNLVSPSSEQDISLLTLSAPWINPTELLPSHIVVTTELSTGPPIGEEEAQNHTVAGKEEEAKQFFVPPATTEVTVKQQSSGTDHNRVQFTITPALECSLSAGDGDYKKPNTPPSPSSPPYRLSSTLFSAPFVAESVGVEGESKGKREPQPKVEPVSSVKPNIVVCPVRPRDIGPPRPKLPSDQTISPTKTRISSPASTGESSVIVEGNLGNLFGVRLRKTVVLHQLSSEDYNTEPTTHLPGSTICTPQSVSVQHSLSQPFNTKPALPKKPDVKGDGGGKPKRSSDPTAVHGGSNQSDSPSWISVAKQRQKIYKDNSLDETSVMKEEPERKSSLPLYVSSSGFREPSTTYESTSPVCPLETYRPAAVEPPQPLKASSHQQPDALKPSSPLNPVIPKRPPQRAISPPTPVPVSQRAASFISPPSLPKIPLPHPASVPSSKSPHSALPQDDPPWMALAKKKSKAWSEMPQIVQ